MLRKPWQDVKRIGRFPVTANVSNPAAPTGQQLQTFCAIDNPTAADLTTATERVAQWHAASTGVEPHLPTTTALANGTHYYASANRGRM